MIAGLNVEKKMLVSANTQYKVIVVPEIESIPLETLVQLKNLARKGATIIFEKDIPDDVPGFYDYENKQNQAAAIKKDMLLLTSPVQVTPSVTETLLKNQIYGEEMAPKGLDFIRKRSGKTTYYFVTNLADKFNEDWIHLNANAKNVEI